MFLVRFITVLIDVCSRFNFGGFFGVRSFAFGEQPYLERFRQFAGADVGGSGKYDQLLGLTVLVARHRRLNRMDLKHRRDRWNSELLLNCVPRLPATLNSTTTFRGCLLLKIIFVR